MKRKHSLVFLLATSVILVSSLINLSSYFYEHYDWYKGRSNKRASMALTYVRIGHNLLASDHVEELRDLLHEARMQKHLDFYILSRNDEVVFFESDGSLEGIDLSYHRFNQMVTWKDYVYLPVQTGEYVLTVGFNNNATGFVQLKLAEDAPSFIRDTVLVVGSIAVILIYLSRDIIGIVIAFSRRGQRDFSGIKARSRESEIVLKGLTGFQRQMDELFLQNELLKGQVLPALQSELSSGRTPPYEFDCTLVRTDINNFSTIFSKYPREEFMNTVNSFFEEATHIISRYGGFVHEFVGDEIIYYFKDEHHPNSAAVALSAIRDLNQAAESIHDFTTRENGYGFIVKSAAACGRLRFGPQVRGYTLAGSVLIETVRILSQITEKEEYTVWFDGVFNERVGFLGKSRHEQTVQLKGLPGPRELYSWRGHHSLEKLLETLGSDNANLLTYYRSNPDLRLIVDTLSLRLTEIPTDVFVSVCSGFRYFQATRTDADLKSAYEGLLEAQLSRDIPRTPDERGARTAAVVAAASHILAPDALDPRLERLLRAALVSQDGRVAANAVESLAHFNAGYDADLLHKLMHHTDGRVAANAIINAGRRDLNRTVIRRLQSMIRSEDSKLAASGLYALGELASWYQRNHPVYFSTHMGIQKLLASIPQYWAHAERDVRRQSHLLVWRAGDSELSARFDQFLASEATSELRAEIETDRPQLTPLKRSA